MRARSRARWAAAAVLVALAGCPTARMHVPVATLALAAPARIAPGDTLRLTARLANPTRDTLAMAFDDGCVVTFHVRAPDRRLLEPSAAPCPPEPVRVVLAPGASRTIPHAWAVPPADAAETLTVYAILSEHHVTVGGGARRYQAAHRSAELRVARAKE